jgi:hypothetical protein
VSAHRAASGLALAAASCAVAALGLTPAGVSAQQAPTCDSVQVDYALAGNLELTDTPLGQGDGIYPVGPGVFVLRFDGGEGPAGKRVKVISYEMREAFKVVSKTLFWATTVTTDTISRAAPDPCGAPEGLLAGNVVAWSSPMSNLRTDGTLVCEGSFCGKFGAPPPGQSTFAIAPHAALFKSLKFSGDMKTFTMASTFASKTAMPKQTAHVALSGREIRRACVSVTCPAHP